MGMPAVWARRLSASRFLAMGKANCSSSSASGSSRSLITSMSSNAAWALSGAFPCKSAFFARIDAYLVVLSELQSPCHDGHLQPSSPLPEAAATAVELMHAGARHLLL